MDLEQIRQIAKNHCHLFGEYGKLTGIFKELPGSVLGENHLQIIGFDKAKINLNEMGWLQESEGLYSKEGIIYHIYIALGYEELIRFMLNPRCYVSNIPSFDWTTDHPGSNEYNYAILQYLLEFSLHYGIKFE